MNTLTPHNRRLGSSVTTPMLRMGAQRRQGTCPGSNSTLGQSWDLKQNRHFSPTKPSCFTPFVSPSGFLPWTPHLASILFQLPSFLTPLPLCPWLREVPVLCSWAT